MPYNVKKKNMVSLLYMVDSQAFCKGKDKFLPVEFYGDFF
jgi:hypothetical protein